MELYVGVDSCPQGWFFVAINKVFEWQVGIARSITDLWGLFSHSELILIDIPNAVCPPCLLAPVLTNRVCRWKLCTIQSKPISFCLRSFRVKSS